MPRTGPTPWTARAGALLPAACIALAAAAPGAAPRDAGHGFADTAGSGLRAGLQVVSWITETADERRIDVYAFDCVRGRYAHVISERYRAHTRIERIALAQERWSAALLPMPPTYPVLAVHRARGIACARAERRR